MSLELVDAIKEQINLDESINGSSTTGNQGSSIIETTSWFGRATLDILGIAAFGHNLNSIRDPSGPLNKTASTYRSTSKTEKRIMLIRYLLSQYLPGWVTEYLPFFKYEEIERTMKPSRDFLKHLIRERRIRIEKDDGSDVLSLAIKDPTFSEEQIIDQLMNIYHAG